MSRQKQHKQKEVIVENKVEETVENTEQAVDSAETFAKKDIKDDVVSEAQEKDVEIPVDEKKASEEQPLAQKEVVKQKSGGKGLALVALLVALAVGGAGHFMANKKFAEVEAQLQEVSAKANQPSSSQNVVEMPSFDAEKAQIAELTTNYQKALERINQLETAQSGYTQKINGLQLQLQKLNTISSADNSAWLLSEADFLLNNALRKVVLDNDIDTAKNLLVEADQVLSQVPKATNIREAIKSDLNTLSNINNIDQNALMQRVANLTTRLDDLPILENEQTQGSNSNNQVTDSIDDWQSNLEKNATSFLDHFIRVSKRNIADEKAFVAPNQEIYLRENIRLRLQIAILAIPRQQNELYTKSLQTVGAWVRSYFETSNENVKNFLKEVDELAEQTIYIDAPNSLQSLKVLEQQINKAPQTIEKVEIKAEQELDQAEPVKENTPSEQAPAEASSSESSAQ
ncbi:uroporphyrinogen-III C-methyltransferase [Mannheimia sp. AT1]|uniref:Uroporphyrinogen-III C-methyltransferase n=1 Tax=Mannheimia cairinae TaxID=3025936 RepID=A0ABT5MNB8_9PAST|nr:uroporphyrinogen-III C-methyltransferase [Mannheimia cairinae]MDD0823680.1 uroporphyrinogen-III C-methyltransferase [Mannheimia cairinae]MDD0825388.1 uroporphyrinogen-III C-methyltransferase [Mannheimia cairinae]